MTTRNNKQLKNDTENELWMDKLIPIVLDFRGDSPEEKEEPLDGDDVDRLCEILKAKINLHEGNITEEEYLSL